MIVLVCLLASLPAGASDLVGKTVPPYPDGMTSHTGTCVTDIAGPEHVCDYAIGTVEDAQGTPKFVIAQQSLGHRADMAVWRVLDVLPYPALRTGQQLSIGTCRLHGSEDAAIVAVVDFRPDDEYTRAAGEAWRLDFAKKRFVAVPAVGIDCINEGYGL